jgi:hypothetical protein
VPRSSSPAAIPTGSTKRRRELGAQRTAAFDANDAASLARFFRDLPRYGPLLEMDSARARQAISDHVVLALEVARNAAAR